MSKDIIYTDIARRVISAEARALQKLSENIPDDFYRIVDYLLHFKGRVILSGIGKSGYIARKIAASFTSTGMPAIYLHPSEASHGDLGIITAQDLVIMLSNSGETKELMDIIEYCRNFSIKIVALTMNPNSTLALKSDFLLKIPKYPEASVIGAPTVSTLIMLSLGDALITAVHEKREFTEDDFKIFHPGGSRGSNLTRISDLMRTKDAIPLVYPETTFLETIVVMNAKCLGCAIVVDKDLHLVGIITDGDLRRHIKGEVDAKYARDLMTEIPTHISPLMLAKEALNLMKDLKITNIPVVINNKVQGIVHIHDLLRAGVT